MSSQKGNCLRSRPQKHKNVIAFKNNRNDTSLRTKAVNETVIDSVCQRCKEIIEWKIKYKKYKPLTVPKKCTKCNQKTIKKAYYILCDLCIEGNNFCGKCAQPLQESSNNVDTSISNEHVGASGCESEPD